MSLLDRKAPHTAYVQLRKIERNEDGARVPVNVGMPIPVRGMGEPVRDWASSEESQAGGIQILDMLVWRSREWPGDTNSLTTIDGQLYETVGAPQHQNISRATRHWRVTLRWRGEA